MQEKDNGLHLTDILSSSTDWTTTKFSLPSVIFLCFLFISINRLYIEKKGGERKVSLGKSSIAKPLRHGYRYHSLIEIFLVVSPGFRL